MLAGLQDQEFVTDPDAQMAEQMKKLEVNQRRYLKGFIARTYDLSDEEQHAQYEYDIENIVTGTNNHTHSIVRMQPLRFVAEPNPRYIAHLEWLEFQVDTQPAETIPTTGD